jgi:lysophospholipase L1-like esterase
MRRVAAILGVAGAVAACAPDTTPSGTPAPEDETVRYVALGDSYTIGTGVPAGTGWPEQLSVSLAFDRPQIELVANLGVNGFTSEDLIRHQLPVLDELDPELVSVLIGVNDVVQGVPEETYAANVATILDDLVARLPADRILCVATPDYTVTPQGGAFGEPDRQRARIERVNQVMGEACAERGIAFVGEIFEISREAETDPSLVATDGLHPSVAQYSRWTDAIIPVVAEMLGS